MQDIPNLKKSQTLRKVSYPSNQLCNLESYSQVQDISKY